MDVTTLPRRVVGVSVWAVCLLLIVRLFFVERFHIPTGSMAPTLLGRHRQTECPRCTCPLHVDQNSDTAFCPNCGKGPIPLTGIPLTDGDHIVADKQPFVLRQLPRWSLVLFRLFGEIFIKRLIGLPGERITVIDGDVYGNGAILRKTFEEAERMRVLVFDNDCQPMPDGWRQRWERRPNLHTAAELLERDCRVLHLRGASAVNEPVWLIYRHYQLDENKCQPIRDEYAYNGSRPTNSSDVHDFLVSCEIETGDRDGWVMLAIQDGGDQAVVNIPVGSPNTSPTGKSDARPFPEQDGIRTLTTPIAVSLKRNRRYNAAFALVDRRLTCRIDGRDVIEPVDLPQMRNRSAVVRPFAVGAKNTDLAIRHVRLYRDVHYTNDGRNGVNGDVVELGPDEYFVLGDNSPNSQDSRFWPDNGIVAKNAIVGRPILLHFPHRWTRWTVFGRAWQLPDWTRIGWLR